MSRLTVRWAAGALACLAAAAVAGPAAGRTSRPSAVGASVREYRIAIYRRHLAAGRVVFNVRNIGEDAHDFEVRGPGLRTRGTTDEIAPGEYGRLSLRLGPGVYTVVCTIADHEQRGMLARFRVRGRTASSRRATPAPRPAPR